MKDFAKTSAAAYPYQGFCQEAQAPAPYRGTDAICQACVLGSAGVVVCCFSNTQESGGLNDLAEHDIGSICVCV